MHVLTADDPPTTRPRGNQKERMAGARAMHLPPVVAAHRVARSVDEVGGKRGVIGIVGARLEQQHLAIGALGGAGRDHRTGRPGPHDDRVGVHGPTASTAARPEETRRAV